MIVLLSEDSSKAKDELKGISENPDLKFKSVKYNYNKLIDIINTIGEGTTRSLYNKKLGIATSIESDIYDDITGTVLLDDENKVEVYIKNLRDLKISKLKKLFKESDAFIFKESVSSTEETFIS